MEVHDQSCPQLTLDVVVRVERDLRYVSHVENEQARRERLKPHMARSIWRHGIAWIVVAKVLFCGLNNSQEKFQSQSMNMGGRM